MEANNSSCGQCGSSPANLRCAQCKAAYYCSAICQKQAWRGHKASCIPVPVSSPSSSSPSPSGAAAAPAAAHPPPPPSDGSAAALIARVKAALGDRLPESLRDVQPSVPSKAVEVKGGDEEKGAAEKDRRATEHREGGDAASRESSSEKAGSCDAAESSPASSGGSAAPAKQARHCLNCSCKSAPLRCSQCKAVWYCCSPCQKAHWKTHKSTCFAPAKSKAREQEDEEIEKPQPSLDDLPPISDGGIPDSIREMLDVACSDGPLPTTTAKGAAAAAAAKKDQGPASRKQTPAGPQEPRLCACCGQSPAPIVCATCLDVAYCTADCQKHHWSEGSMSPPAPASSSPSSSSPAAAKDRESAVAHRHRCDPALPSRRSFLPLPPSFALSESASDYIYVDKGAGKEEGRGFFARARKRASEHEVVLTSAGLCAPVLLQKHMKDYCWHCFGKLPDAVKATAERDPKKPPSILHCGDACRKKDVHYEAEMKGIRHVHPQFPSAVVLLSCRIIRLFVKDPSIKRRAECLLKPENSTEEARETARKKAERTYHFSHHSSLDAAGARVAINLGLSWIAALIERLDLNGFQVSIKDGEYNVGMGVFDAAACFNHSCESNVLHQFKIEEGSQPAMEVKALRNIHRGEELTFSYVQVDSCTRSRREMLWEQYRFVCECPKCLDPLQDAHAEGYKCQVDKCKGVGVRFLPASSPDKSPSAKALSYGATMTSTTNSAKKKRKAPPKTPEGTDLSVARYCSECASLGPFEAPRALPTVKDGDVYWFVDGVDIRELGRVKLTQLYKAAHPWSTLRLALGQNLLARILIKNDDSSNRDMLEAALLQKANVEASAFLHYQNNPLIHDEMDKFMQLKLKLTERKVKQEVGIPDVPDWMLELIAMAQGPMGGLF